jgi:hypothetical protein
VAEARGVVGAFLTEFADEADPAGNPRDREDVQFSQSAVSRWLAAAKATLLADVKKILRRQLGTSSNELASLARMVASRLDMTLTSVLKRA